MLSHAYLNIFKAIKMKPKSLKNVLEFCDANDSEMEALLISDIMKYLKPKLYVVALGSTNAGKSTLMNRILKTELLKSSE
jgi:ribosome biogenesis GTPase A